MRNNKGYEVEFYMRNWFKGKPHHDDCVDFQTSKCLYEVKSCRLFNKCNNGNDKRKFSEKKHKRISTTQLGRFHIKNFNHESLMLAAKLENKIPKYIFVVCVGKQKIWSVRSWEEVNEFIDDKKDNTRILIKNIFGEI